MKKLSLILLSLTFCTTAFGESQLQKATNVLNEIMQTPDHGIPSELLEKAVCVHYLRVCVADFCVRFPGNVVGAPSPH